MKALNRAAQLAAVYLLIAFAGSAAAQQDYPGKQIRFIVPYPPGGSTTPLARLVGQKLTEKWGQPVIVDNRPGGSGVIGYEALAKSAPDGYTILFATTSHILTPLLLPTSYDIIRDFAPVATIGGNQFILALHPSLPAHNLQEFIAFAKSRPGQLNYTAANTGSVSHLGGELFSSMAGVRMQHIPYKGGGPAITDLIGGQVHLAFQVPVDIVHHVKANRLKAIAVTGDSRLPALPQVPTFAESGMPGFNIHTWNGIFVPAGTPRPIIDKLANEIASILAMPDVQKTMVSRGTDPVISTPDRFSALLKAEMARYAKIIKAANIKLDN